MANQARLQIIIDAENQARPELKGLTDDLRKMQTDLDGVREAQEKTTAQQQRYRTSLTEIQSGVMIAREALGGLKQVWDFAKEGAQLELQRGRFDRLAVSIGTTADALKGELAAATKGMLSDAEQIELGTRLISLGMAKTSDQAVRMTKIISALDMDMGQFVLTIANQSTMRFDQLGVSIDGFDDQLAKLKATGLDTEAAFKEAFLQQAEAQMARLGDTADTTAGKMKKVEATLNNVGDRIKEIAASGIEAGITMVEAPAKLGEAFAGTAKQMQADLIAGRMTLEDYNNGLRGMADAMRPVAGAAADTAYQTYALTAAQQQQLLVMNQVDYATRLATEATRAAAEADAQRAQSLAQAQTAAETHTTVMQSYSNELLYNVQKYQEQQAAAEAAAAAEAIHRGSIAESVTANQKLAQSLKEATDAQATQMLAQAQLDVINQAFKEGKITQDDYNLAIDQVLLKYDLATPKSIAMADAQKAINQAFLDGNLPLNDYITATEKIPGIAADGKVTLEELASAGVRPTTAAVGEQKTAVGELKTAWDQIPPEVTTTYKIVTEGEAPAAGDGSTRRIPSRQGGGPTDGGGLFMLHPNEWVLSEAQRMGRKPIPEEALPGAAQASSTSTNTSNITINIGAISKDYTPQTAGDDIVNRLRSRGIIA